MVYLELTLKTGTMIYFILVAIWLWPKHMVIGDNVDFKLSLGISFSRNMHSTYAVSDTATLLYNIKIPNEPHKIDKLNLVNPCNDLIIHCPMCKDITRSDTQPNCASESSFMCNTLFNQLERAHSKSDNL